MRWLLALLCLCAACAPKSDGSHTIVVSSYPVEFVVRQVVDEGQDVHDLAKPGVEPHDLELTSDDIDAIGEAQAVFYIGAGFQPAVAAAAKRAGDRAVDIGRGLMTRKGDPHFWLDPTLLAKAADTVAAKMKADASAFKADITRLDDEYRGALSQCQRKTFVTTHQSFGYLAARYGLAELSISGNSPEAEPSPKRIADLAATIPREGITTVFYEPRVPRAAAETVAREANVATAVLDPFESTRTDYFTVMRRNLAALKTALGCS